MNEMNAAAEPSFRTYAEAVNWITSLIAVGEKPGMKRMEAFMEKLGHPERRLKFIHVAGTNGKGSTCAYLTRVLVQAGYDVGTFTSPYLEKFTDRIRYNGENISDEELLRLANQVKSIADEIALTELLAPTMFEVTTAIALLYYATVTYPDYVVWETGLGGRLDPSNIVTPVISVITNVGHDHMDILGNTLSQIAAEKAGIIKPGVPVVSAVDQPEVIETIARIAKERKSTLYLAGKQFRYETTTSEPDRQVLQFEGPFRKISDVVITLNGAHQVTNAAVALMTLEVLRQYYALIVDDDDLYKAMRETEWPGRLELVSREPRILLDGAHNPEGAEALASALKNIYAYRRLHMMVGMLTTKNHLGYLRHILPLVDTLIITEPEWRKKVTAAELAELAASLRQQTGRDVEVIVEPNWRQALDQLIALTKQDDLAVVSGTLYLISDVRTRIKNRSDF